jgi:hypothetical protein
MNKALLVIVAIAVTVLEGVAQNANLKILVIAGEGAVNIIQQKTAVAPVVEIRDRNNLPVSGATVTFSIGGGNTAAFAGGAQTLTVTTNAAGQAAAAALNPLSGGSFQIQVSATFQGQTAAATIAQTNVLTAAEAAAQTAGASGAGGAGGSSGGGAAAGGASGGGGLSGTTIGIVGAAVGGGALAATQVGGLTGGDGGKSTPFSGTFSAQMVFTQNSGGIICDSTRALAGTLKITLEDGETKGFADVTGTYSETGFTASPFCSPIGNQQPLSLHVDVTGGPAALAASFQSSATSTGVATVTSTVAWSFTGSLSGGAITGTLTYTETTSGIGTPGGNVISGRGTVAMPVTLR